MDSKQNNIKSFLKEKLSIENIKIFFDWLLVIAILVGGIFVFIMIYKNGGIHSILLLVVLFTPISLYTIFYDLWSKRKRLIFILLSTLIYVASGCYCYFSTPTPEEIFSHAMEQINKNNQQEMKKAK